MADVAGMGPILVTGATGFLGGQVVRQLRDLGCDVIGVGRNEDKLAALGGAVQRHDIANPFVVSKFPEIGAIVHCAALSAPFGPRAEFERSNVDGTQHVLDLCRENNVSRLVHISTPSIYFSHKDQLDIGEDYPLPPPVNHYAATKAMAEELVQAQIADSAIILRPRGIYGSGDTALLPRVLRAARSRPLPLLRGGQAAIDLTHVDDVVDAIIAALGAPHAACGAAYNVSGGECLPIRDIVDQVCQRAHVESRWRAVPLRPAMIAAGALEMIASLRSPQREPVVTRYGLGLFAYRQSLNLTRARTTLGWSPKVSFNDGLERTFGAQV